MSEAIASVLEEDKHGFRTLCRDRTPSSLTPSFDRHNKTSSSPRTERPNADVDQLLTFLDQYPQAWRVLQEVLGPKEALHLAQLRRNEAMTTLRVKHRWSLQAIGDLFDLSRERVRQITPSIAGNGTTPDLEDGRPSDPRKMRFELAAVFRKAIRTPQAWNGRGQVSKAWVIEQLGYEPEIPELDFRRLGDSKAEFILRHGLELQTKQDMRSWLKEMYFERHMTYAEIAHWLSERFVSVAPMTVHRFATGILDIDGYGRGKRVDR